MKSCQNKIITWPNLYIKIIKYKTTILSLHIKYLIYQAYIKKRNKKMTTKYTKEEFL